MNRSTEPDFDQRIADWLEDEPNLAPRQALETVLAAYPSIPQRRTLRAPRRLSTMTMPIRLATAALIGVLVVGAAFYLSRPDQSAIGGPSPKPSPSQIASVPASQSASPSLAVVVPTSSSVVSARAPGWSATGGMTEARTQYTATLLSDGKVLVAGGGDRGTTSAELYDPGSGTWSATGSMHGARRGQTATRLLNGTVLVAGGTNDLGDPRRLRTAELYDPVGGTWTATGDMLGAGVGYTATLLSDGRVLVVGGEFGSPSAELYDPGSGTWTATGDMPVGRFGYTATLLRDGRVLVTGGLQARGGARGPTAELYDPSTGSWSATGNMQHDRHGHTATLLPDGRVLVAGGVQIGAKQNLGTGLYKELASAELYDPASGTWTATGNMVRRATVAGLSPAATLLPDGKVLVAGGFRSDGNGALASAELYDPVSGTWTATSSMDEARAEQTATLLLDGKVLVAGGVINGSFSPVASAELYDPGSGN
jgi:hypothetical protein